MLLLWAGPALAHELPFGATGFAALVIHPLYVPDFLICLLCASLLTGQQARLGLLPGFAALSAGILAGVFAQPAMPPGPLILLMPMIVALLAGLLIAAAPPLPGWVCAACVAVIGFVVGHGGAEPRPDVARTLVAAAAVMIAGGISLLVVAAPASLLTRPWGRIGLRIAGSWIAAVAVMILSLSLRYGF